MSQFYEVVIKYDKSQENGSIKRVHEKYIAEALSITEAEAIVTERMQPFISGDFIATSSKVTKIAEISGMAEEKFFMAKVAFITIDERSAQEKKTLNQILIGASDFKQAYTRFETLMKGSMTDYELQSLSETQIKDVFLSK